MMTDHYTTNDMRDALVGSQNWICVKDESIPAYVFLHFRTEKCRHGLYVWLQKFYTLKGHSFWEYDTGRIDVSLLHSYLSFNDITTETHCKLSGEPFYRSGRIYENLFDHSNKDFPVMTSLINTHVVLK